MTSLLSFMVNSAMVNEAKSTVSSTKFRFGSRSLFVNQMSYTISKFQLCLQYKLCATH